MTLAIVLICAIWAVAIPVFWIMWFRSDPSDEGRPAGYVTHERAFLLPDSTLALLLGVTTLLALSGSNAMTTVGLVASGMMLFLGLIDLSYDLGNRASAWEYAVDVAIIISAGALIFLLTIGEFA